MDTDSKKTARKAFGVCQVCNICESKDSKICSSGWLVGTTKSGASPDKTNLVSKSSAINSNGCCAGGLCGLNWQMFVIRRMLRFITNLSNFVHF